MKSRVFVFCFISLNFIFNNINAQKSFFVKIKFPANLNTNKITINYDNWDGSVHKVSSNFSNGETNISGNFNSEYVIVNVQYSRDENYSYSSEFWVKEKQASITFLNNKDSTKSPFENFTLKNAYSLNEMGEEEFNKYIFNENKDFIDFLKNNDVKMRTNDSLVRVAFSKNKILCNKMMEFVKNNKDSYFSLWRFSKLIHGDFEVDMLKKIFNDTFSDRYKKSFEGSAISKALIAKSLKKGEIAPLFISKDIFGKKIALSDLHNKYVLLVFWASWCGPCIKEIPTIKEIYEKYPKDKLEVLSVSSDKDSLAFSKAVKKYAMDWVQIYNDKTFENSYNCDNVIPKVFLIDTKGKLIYNMDEEEDHELNYLKKLLSKII